MDSDNTGLCDVTKGFVLHWPVAGGSVIPILLAIPVFNSHIGITDHTALRQPEIPPQALATNKNKLSVNSHKLHLFMWIFTFTSL